MKAKVVLNLACSVLAILTFSCRQASDDIHFPERRFTSPWSMDANRLKVLIASVNRINPGDDIKLVLQIVGPPDRDYTVKKNDIDRFLTYHVTRQRIDSRIESDQVVVIVLNKNNKVKAIYSNVDGIVNRNWPPNTTRETL